MSSSLIRSYDGSLFKMTLKKTPFGFEIDVRYKLSRRRVLYPFYSLYLAELTFDQNVEYDKSRL